MKTIAESCAAFAAAAARRRHDRGHRRAAARKAASGRPHRRPAQDIDTLNPRGRRRSPSTRSGTCSTPRSPTRRRTTSRHDPGPRRVVGGSDDGKTYTYTLRDGPQVVRRRAADRRGRRLHDQPLARGGVAQLHSHRRQPQGEGASTTARSRSVARCRTRSCRRWTSTSSRSTSRRSTTRRPSRSTTRSTASARARSRSTSARRASSGRFKANPNYWRRQARARPGRLPLLQQRATRWSPRCSSGEIDAAHDVPAQRVRARCRGPRRHRRGRGPAGRLQRARDQRRRTARRRTAAPGAAGHRSSARRSPTRSTSRRCRPRAARARRARRHDQPVRRTRVDPGDPGGRAVRLRPRQAQPDPRRRRLPGHRRRRHPRDARRRPADSSSATPSARSREVAPPIAEFITGWLKEIGIATTQQDRTTTASSTEVIGKGDYDLFVWGWTPFVDPDPMLSYFTCDQVATDPDDPTNYYNDANWCDGVRQLYEQQKVELDPEKRVEIVHEMLTRFYDAGRLHRALRRAGPAGLPHRPLRGLGAAAGGDRPGAVHQHVADATRRLTADRRRPAAATAPRQAAIDGGGGRGRDRRDRARRRAAPARRRSCGFVQAPAARADERE